MGHHDFQMRILQTWSNWINAREYRKDNQKWTIQRNWQDEEKQNAICVGHHYTQTDTNNVNKTRVPLQTTGG